MKFLLITLLFLKMLQLSKIEKNINDISSKADKIKKTRKSRILFGVNEKLKKVLAQRSKYIKTEKFLKLNPKRHLDLASSTKQKLLNTFGEEERNEPKYRMHEGKKKIIVALESRFPIRTIKKNQMQCTLYVKNYGVNFHKLKRLSRLRLDFRSNCFKNTYTKYYIGVSMYKNPIGIKINLDFINIGYLFKNIRTDYNFSYIFSTPYYARLKDLDNHKKYEEETQADNSTTAHVRKLKLIKKKKKEKKIKGKKTF